MINANIKLIIDKLIAKTNAGQAIWSKTSRDTEFKLELSKGAITTDMWEDEHGYKMVDLSVYNANGEIIENDVFHESDEESDFTSLQNVYESAKKSYYKIDETFKTIFDELDGEKTIGRSKELPF